MDIHLFYTTFAEAAKSILYILFLIMIGIGLWQRHRGHVKWASWIHATIFLNFIIGGLYGGIRMLTTDPVENMFIRRMFAWEAWFCFAVASFYFLILYLKQSKPGNSGQTYSSSIPSAVHVSDEAPMRKTHR